MDNGGRDQRKSVAGGFPWPFYRYWLSGFLSDFGNGMRLTAFPLLAAQLTRAPAAVATVTAMQGVPWLLLGTGAGVLVDRVDRRRLMVTVDAARVAIIAGLAGAVIVHEAGLVLIYIAALLTGAGSALRGTAAVTCVPRLVEPDDLDKANGRVIAGQIVGSELAGPAASGWLFGVAAVLPFAVNAGTLGIAVLLLLTLPGDFTAPPRGEPGPARPRLSSARHDAGEGLRWMWRHTAIRDLTIMAGVTTAMDAAWFAVLVLYVVKDLHQRPGAYGLLLAIGAVGGVAAGAAAGTLTRRAGPWRSLLPAGLVLAATQAGLGLTGNLIVAAVLLMLSSAAWALCNMIVVTMLQREVPDALLGRVTSLYGTVAQSAEALGAIAGGVLAGTAGIRAPMLIGAAPIAAVTLVVSWRHRTGTRRKPASAWGREDAALPVVLVQHLAQRPARGAAEGVTGVVGGGDERALADIVGEPEQPGDLRLIPQVQRGPGGSESPGPAGQHVAPRGGQQRPPQAGLRLPRLPVRTHRDARDHLHRHLAHVPGEVLGAAGHPRHRLGSDPGTPGRVSGDGGGAQVALGRSPVVVPDSRAYVRVGHHDPVPVLAHAAVRRLKRDLQALPDQVERHRPGQVQPLAHRPGRGQQFIRSHDYRPAGV
jgi:MFS family permease